MLISKNNDRLHDLNKSPLLDIQNFFYLYRTLSHMHIKGELFDVDQFT